MKTYNELSSAFLHNCQYTRRLDAKTLRAYAIDLNQFHFYLNVSSLPYHEKDTISTYLETLHSRYAPASVKRKIATLKAFFHFAEREGFAENPFHKLDTSFREPQKLPRYIPLHTIQEFRNTIYEAYRQSATPKQKLLVLRDIAVIELLFSTGIRISELCLLPVSSIDLDAQEIKIYGKGSKERLLTLNAAVTSSLRQYLNAFRKQIETEGFFFVSIRSGHLTDQSVRYMINKYSSRTAGKLHITPHMFRHSFAKCLLEQDVDIRIIQRILGHSSIQTTERYTFVSSSKQKEVLQSKNPLYLLNTPDPMKSEI